MKIEDIDFDDLIDKLELEDDKYEYEDLHHYFNSIKDNNDKADIIHKSMKVLKELGYDAKDLFFNVDWAVT